VRGCPAERFERLSNLGKTLRYLPIIAELAIVFIAVDLRIFVPAPAWVERNYSNGFYPRIDAAIRAFTAPQPFSVGDVLLIIAFVALIAWWLDAIGNPRRSMAKLGRVLLGTVTALAVVYIWFMTAWAYNYDRVPLAEKIVLHNERTNEATVAAFADRVVDELDRYAEAAHAQRDARVTLPGRIEPTFDAAIRRFGDLAKFSQPPLKPTIFQPLMAMSGTDGFMDPWTHEINLDEALTTYERPAVLAHEWAHLAGFADESEANLIAVLSCRNADDPLLRYSAWLLVWFNLPSNVHVTHSLSPLAYEDIQDIKQRYQREVNPTVARVQRKAYDTYLRANRVKAGYASYQIFVRWLTAADFDASGLPRVRR